MITLARLHLDRPLLYALAAVGCLSCVILYSASAGDLGALGRHLVRFGIGFVVMFTLAQLRPETLQRAAPGLYVIGVALLVAVLMVGSVSKGARRWLDFGAFTFQPSEIMKLVLPMMLGWFFARDSLPPRSWRLAVGALLILVPVGLIAKQPDLGTAILVMGAGLAVLFLTGMHWKIITGIAGLVAVLLPIGWHFMHDYQRQRVYTLLDPASDPLGAGYHTIQSMIAVGSGGFFGKGWFGSSQAHLDYLPESHTDFIFAVFAEEFGLLGILALLGLYLFIVGRGLAIAYYAQTTFNRLTAGGLTLIFFFYFFVNIGMVTGVLPVVGVPLPLVSYGGSATVTLMAAFGMLMSIHTHRKIAA